jgi:cob(I)alamin adenosyltransferase
MANIYTRTGDEGDTSLFGGQRVRKDDLRIEAIGGIDETNAALSLALAELADSGKAPAGLVDLVTKIQHRLFDLGAELASPGSAGCGGNALDDTDVTALEVEIDRWDAGLAPLRQFILPGGTATAARLHFARCVCRRSERRLVELSASEPVRGELLRYVNRLGDLLFVLARSANAATGVPDVIWEPKSKANDQ